MIGSNAILILQKYEETVSDTGAPSPGFGDVKRIKGRLDKVSTGERVARDKLGEDATHRFICRYFKDIEVTVADRFRRNNIVFNITGITNFDNHSYEFTLKET